MKALVISSNAELERSLAHQFEMRKRQFMLVDATTAGRLRVEDLANSIVIEASTLSALQSNNKPPMSPEQRDLLFDHCAQANTPVLLLSDGRVFDGAEAPLNHREDEQPSPASVAGGQLVSLETALIATLEKHLILRTGPLFSEHGDNFLTRIFSDLLAGKTLSLSSQLKFCPTHMADLARVVSGVVDQVACDAQCWGVYHYNSSGQSSAYEFAEVAYAFASQQVDLVSADPSLEDSSGGMKFEPPVPVLRCEKILRHFGVKQLPWRSYLPKAIKYLCEGESK